MGSQRANGHTVSRLTVHIVWSTKYRFSVLKGDVQKRCRLLLIQICDSEDIVILKGVVSKIIFICTLSIVHHKILVQ